MCLPALSLLLAFVGQARALSSLSRTSASLSLDLQVEVPSVNLAARQHLRPANDSDSEGLHYLSFSGYREVGDGAGRPLYNMNVVELPANRTGRHCVTLRMDSKTHALTIDPGDHDVNSIAWGCFNDAINETGWSMLSITSSDSPKVPVALRAYGAGMLEGVLTYERIEHFTHDVIELFEKDIENETAVGTETKRVVRQSLAAWEAMAGGNPDMMPEDDLGQQAWVALLQFRGIRDGYNMMIHQTTLGRPRSSYDFMLVNMHAELPSVMQMWGRSLEGLHYTDPNNSSNTGYQPEWRRWSAHKSKGTAFVRRVGSALDPEDFISGHATFGEYSQMTRMMKRYHLNTGTLVTDIALSSYPGCISSTDDYFQTNRGFVLMSTSLYVPPSGNYSKPDMSYGPGLPAFLRATIATRLATLPRMWARLYGTLPGVAAAKQWLLVDYSRLKDQQPISNDTVWLVESLPTLQRSADVTHLLRSQGFAEAHGVPYFRQIREAFGYDPHVPSSYEEHRSSALVDQASTIGTLDDARGVLSTVGGSRGAEQIEIAARLDLQNSNRSIPAGSIDGKVASKCLVEAFSFLCRSGPPVPTSGKAFAWTDEHGGDLWKGWPHGSQPNRWAYDWVSIKGEQGQLHYPLAPDDSECEPASRNPEDKL